MRLVEKKIRTNKKALASVLAASVFVGVFAGTAVFPATAADGIVTTGNINQSLLGAESRDRVYSNYIKNYAGAPLPMESITIEAKDYIATAPDEVTGGSPVLTVGEYEGVADSLFWHNSEGDITYTFSVRTSGLYCLESNYYPTSEIDALTGEVSSNTIELGFLLDGDFPFMAAKTFSLDRLWADSSAIRKDSKDNELRPTQKKYDEWMNEPVKDKEGLFNEPYSIYLSAGEHTMTWRGIKVLTIFKSFTFTNYDTPTAYANIAPTAEQIEATQALTTENPNFVGTNTIFIQGENPLYKSASTLYATYDRTSYSISPSHPTKQRYNTIGQETWNKATQAITWEFAVPNDGYYRFNFKARQNITRGFFSNRRVYIDGVVPCEELLDQKFPYDPNWYVKSLTDYNGNDIYLKLTAGKHTITLEAVPGDIGEVMQRLDELVFGLNSYYRRILMITGPNPDIYNDYFLDKQIPELIPEFAAAAKQLREEKAQIEALAGRSGSGASSLETLAVILEKCVRRVDDIPAMRQTIKDTLSSVSAWMRDYRDQPLELDFFEVATVHETVADSGRNLFEQMFFDFNAFIGSFFENYTKLTEADGFAKSLSVWVSQGRDQAVVVKELVDGDFNVNNEFGLQVAINLVQGSILEATLAGKGPEVALFIGGDFPIQLAARDLLVDMTQFPDFEDVMRERFAPNARVLYSYNKGVYGLPVSQNFPMMFYRTDVFEELGIDVPETWDDFIDVIPVLQRKYLTAGLISPNNNLSSATFDPGDTFAMLMLQRGLNIYTDDLMKTTYDQQPAIEAFEQWTKFYTVYNSELVYDAFTRFRTGEMPVLIQNYTFFNQLSTSAPEIKGLWDFALVPGTEREDGTVDHAANSGGAGAVIFSKVGNPLAAWEFVKWFTSTEIMTEYGQTIEALMGPLGRFDAANMEALRNLSWSTSEYRKISTQMLATKEVPIIPASYSATRDTKNAFRAVVNQHRTPRFVFMQYNRDIDAEIARKNEELSVFNS